MNMVLVNLGPSVIALPDGSDITSMEGLAASMPNFAPGNFIFPFLGHALGTLTGAWIAAKWAASHNRYMAIGIGTFFLIGGIMMSIQLPAPLWFELIDVIFAYIPMGYLGAYLAGK